MRLIQILVLAFFAVVSFSACLPKKPTLLCADAPISIYESPDETSLVLSEASLQKETALMKANNFYKVDKGWIKASDVTICGGDEFPDYSLPSMEQDCEGEVDDADEVPESGCWWTLGGLDVSLEGWLLCHKDSPCGDQLSQLEVGDSWLMGKVKSVNEVDEATGWYLNEIGANYLPVAQICSNDDDKRILIIFEFPE